MKQEYHAWISWNDRFLDAFFDMDFELFSKDFQFGNLNVLTVIFEISVFSKIFQIQKQGLLLIFQIPFSSNFFHIKK